MMQSAKARIDIPAFGELLFPVAEIDALLAFIYKYVW